MAKGTKPPLSGAERLRLYRDRKRNGILDVVLVPTTFPQANWLIKHGYLDRSVLRLDTPAEDRREALGQAIEKFLAVATQTRGQQ